jgi:hypothetical protein
MELLRRRSDRGFGDEIDRIFQRLQDQIKSRLQNVELLHKRQARQLNAYRTLFHSIANLSQAGDDFFVAAAKAPVDLLELSGSALCAIDPADDGRLIPVAHENVDLDDPDDLVFKLDNPIVKALREEGTALAMVDLVGKAGPRSRKRAALRRLKIKLAVPLQDSDNLYGVLFLSGRTDDEPFTREQYQFLDDFAVLLTLALKSHQIQTAAVPE